MSYELMNYEFDNHNFKSVANIRLQNRRCQVF